MALYNLPCLITLIMLIDQLTLMKTTRCSIMVYLPFVSIFCSIEASTRCAGVFPYISRECIYTCSILTQFISKPTLPLWELDSAGQISQVSSPPSKVPNWPGLSTLSQSVPGSTRIGISISTISTTISASSTSTVERWWSAQGRCSL